MKGVGQAVLKVVKTNRLAEAAVRITLTRGAGLPGLDPKNCKSPTLLITCRPFSGYPSNFTRKGMTAVVVGVRRNSPESLPPSVKSISCLNNVLAKIESQRSKADEAIMLSEDGLVAEGSVTNVFIVKEGAIYTPALDGRQLAGVTRNHVCQVARANGFRVVETKVSVHDLLSADEVFLTNSLMEVMPVAKVLVGKTVKLKPNWPITRQLMICYTPPRRKSNRTSGSI